MAYSFSVYLLQHLFPAQTEWNTWSEVQSAEHNTEHWDMSNMHLYEISIAFSLAYLKNDNLAIISLQVERPRGGDQAVGLVHYILP